MGYPAPDVRTAVRTGDTTARERRAAAKRPPHILVTTPGVAVHPADLGVGAPGAARRPHGDRRRDPRRRRATSAARTWRCRSNGWTRWSNPPRRPREGPARCSGSACRRRCGPSSRGAAAGGRRPGPAGHRRRRPAPRHGPGHRGARGRAGRGLHQRAVGRDLRPHRRAGARAPLDAGVRQHPPAGRAGGARTSASAWAPTPSPPTTAACRASGASGAEQRLKDGELKVVVATASLELGIDVGAVDLVCLIGSPRSIATGLQRIGRSGHALRATPKGRLFPLTRDQLVECAALVRAARRGELDRDQPARRAARHPGPADRRRLRRRRSGTRTRSSSCSGGPAPYAALARADFDAVVDMLSEGIATSRGRAGALLHRDAVNRRLRGRRGARLAAITSGGAIPDNANYDVVLEPEGTLIGTVDEDFAIESHGRRHLPARQHLVADPARRDRGGCGSRTPAARRRPSRSGWARRRRARASCRPRSRRCAPRSRRRWRAETIRCRR